MSSRMAQEVSAWKRQTDQYTSAVSKSCNDNGGVFVLKAESRDIVRGIFQLLFLMKVDRLGLSSFPFEI